MSIKLSYIIILTHSHKKIKPPLQNKLAEGAKKVWGLSPHFATDFDTTGSIGKRYRRQDEIGTPFCVTVDFETPEDQAVTARDRDSMRQERVKVVELKEYLREKIQ